MIDDLSLKETIIIRDIQRDIDIIVASLLLTGQITLTRIYFGPGYFGVTVGGPLTGAKRLETKFNETEKNLSLDIIDILLALFLVKDLINVVGLFIASDATFSISISGPLFGRAKVVPIFKHLKNNETTLKNIVKDGYFIHNKLLRELKNTK
ncbi:hypothetical protein [Niallia nealsonii]|uniref:Uncharacterized protein n=1 Tax=Niallia nealsonii TaxID=115979 RepID=A0A2N0Z3E0_9BACI|nr:hypothetical protein [Niallia nealsonii]PKG23999.1 hypothetical protein CWS01_09555 [Niallia nealsonii]